MRNMMDSLPSSLRFADGILTREEANEAWKTWRQMKADEIASLEAA